MVGIDGVKAWLDVAVRPSGAYWRVANPDATWPTLGAAGLPVAVVTPRQVRDLAQATGRLAKTDVLDAHTLAHFAQAVRPESRPLGDAATQRRAALLERRSQLVAMLTAEKTRRQPALTSVRPLIQEHSYWLAEALERLTPELDDLLQASPLWRECEHLLRSVPGVGPILACTLVAALPELGRLAPKRLAALVGGARRSIATAAGAGANG